MNGQAWAYLALTLLAVVVFFLLLRWTIEPHTRPRRRKSRLVQVGDVLVDPKHVIAAEPAPAPNQSVRLHLSTGSMVTALETTSSGAALALEGRTPEDSDDH